MLKKFARASALAGPLSHRCLRASQARRRHQVPPRCLQGHRLEHGPHGAWSRAKSPTTKEDFARRADIVAFVSKLTLEGFTPGTDKGDTRSKARICQDGRFQVQDEQDERRNCQARRDFQDRSFDDIKKFMPPARPVRRATTITKTNDARLVRHTANSQIAAPCAAFSFARYIQTRFTTAQTTAAATAIHTNAHRARTNFGSV